MKSFLKVALIAVVVAYSLCAFSLVSADFSTDAHADSYYYTIYIYGINYNVDSYISSSKQQVNIYAPKDGNKVLYVSSEVNELYVVDVGTEIIEYAYGNTDGITSYMPYSTLIGLHDKYTEVHIKTVGDDIVEYSTSASYTVEFYGYEETKLESATVTEGSAVSKIDAPEVTGYTFLYWADSDGNKYDFDNEITADLKLFAVYEQDVILTTNYTVVFYGYNETELATATVTEGSAVSKIDAPEVTGYTFLYWVDSNDNEYKFASAVTDNLNLYAKYEINSYDVAFYNIYAEYLDEVSVDYGSYASAIDAPEVTGYTFLYWADSNDNEYMFASAVTDNLNLYAKYEINSYDVAFYNIDAEYLEKVSVDYGG
ncbi:MAG: InlB B-repeat-containing protein, partial [Bacillota bacterium]